MTDMLIRELPPPFHALAEHAMSALGALSLADPPEGHPTAWLGRSQLPERSHMPPGWIVHISSAQGPTSFRSALYVPEFTEGYYLHGYGAVHVSQVEDGSLACSGLMSIRRVPEGARVISGEAW